MTLSVLPQSSVSVRTKEQSRLSVQRNADSHLSVKQQGGGSHVSVSAQDSSKLAVAECPHLTMTISEVCVISGGDITVLAASDGPLRTKDGSYILLDPEREPS